MENNLLQSLTLEALRQATRHCFVLGKAEASEEADLESAPGDPASEASHWGNAGEPMKETSKYVDTCCCSSMKSANPGGVLLYQVCRSVAAMCNGLKI